MEINDSSLDIYNTTESLSLRIYDYSNFYLLPSICLFGIVTSSLNILVIIKINKLNENVYLYMLINSISDLVFLITQIFVGLIRCGFLCPYGYTYGAKFYELYIYLFAGYTIIIFDCLINISVSIDRLRSFSSKQIQASTSRKMFLIRCICLFALSVLILLPIYMLPREIKAFGLLNLNGSYETLYIHSLKPSWKIPLTQTLVSGIIIAKGPILLLLFICINCFVGIKFAQHIKNKKNVTSSKHPDFKFDLKVFCFMF